MAVPVVAFLSEVTIYQATRTQLEICREVPFPRQRKSIE